MTGQPPRRAPTAIEAARAIEALCEAACRQSLAAFTRRAWATVNPGTERALQWNWHHEAVCQHLEAVADGRIQKLCISIAPGHTKTSLVSVMLPAWVWLSRPEARIISASYEQELSSKANRDRRALIESEWYRRQFGDHLRLDRQSRILEFENQHGGFMMSTSVGGRGTGRHADFLLIDDALKAGGIYTADLETHVRWYTETFSSRVVDPATSAQIIIAQRLHKRDLPGVLIEQGWEHLFLPTEYSAAKAKVTIIGWRDPRTVEGELLFPARFTPAYIERLKGPFGIGAIAFAAQQNQDPVAGEGNIFKRSWFRHYDRLPDDFDEVVGSWDFTFKRGVATDFVVGQIWCRKGANFYLMDQTRGRMDFTESLAEFVAFAEKWRGLLIDDGAGAALLSADAPDPWTPVAGQSPGIVWLVEDAANGPAIIATLKEHIPGIVAVKPRGSKEARAAAVAPMVEAGNVWLPGPMHAPWVGAYVEELCAFPSGDHDDQCDCTSMALDRMRSGAAAYTLTDLTTMIGPARGGLPGRVPPRGFRASGRK